MQMPLWPVDVVQLSYMLSMSGVLGLMLKGELDPKMDANGLLIPPIVLFVLVLVSRLATRPETLVPSTGWMLLFSPLTAASAPVSVLVVKLDSSPAMFPCRMDHNREMTPVRTLVMKPSWRSSIDDEDPLLTGLLPVTDENRIELFVRDDDYNGELNELTITEHGWTAG